MTYLLCPLHLHLHAFASGFCMCPGIYKAIYAIYTLNPLTVLSNVAIIELFIISCNMSESEELRIM